MPNQKGRDTSDKDLKRMRPESPMKPKRPESPMKPKKPMKPMKPRGLSDKDKEREGWLLAGNANSRRARQESV